MNDGNEFNNSIEVIGNYDEIFEVELEGWCFGLQHFTGQVHKAVVYRVVKELRTAIHEAVVHHFIFDIIDVASKIAKAAKYKVEEQDIAFCILSVLPNPSELDEVEQTVVLQIIDKVEQVYGGALEKMRRKWSGDATPLYRDTDESDEVEGKEAA